MGSTDAGNRENESKYKYFTHFSNAAPNFQLTSMNKSSLVHASVPHPLCFIDSDLLIPLKIRDILFLHYMQVQIFGFNQMVAL